MFEFLADGKERFIFQSKDGAVRDEWRSKKRQGGFQIGIGILIDGYLLISRTGLPF